MIVGFTGTSGEVTDSQAQMLSLIVKGLADDITFALHGDCVGADALFDGLCKSYGIKRMAFPGTDGHGDSPKRAYCDADEVRDPAPYLVRNKAIVDAADVLIACPSGPHKQRSGEWSTVRYAAERGVPVTLIWPDGTAVPNAVKARDW